MRKKVIASMILFIGILYAFCCISYAAGKDLDTLYQEAVKESQNNKITIDNWKRDIEARITMEMAQQQLKNDGIDNPTSVQIIQKKQELLKSIKKEYDNKMDKKAAKKVCAYLDAYFKIKDDALKGAEKNAEKAQKQADKTGSEEKKTDVQKAKDEFDAQYNIWKEKYKDKDTSKLSYDEQIGNAQEQKEMTESLGEKLKTIGSKDKDYKEYSKKYEEVVDKQIYTSEKAVATEEKIIEDAKIYKWPEKTSERKIDASSDGVENIISDADSFVEAGAENKIDNPDMQKTFSYIYNIFLQIGIGISVIIGLILGIRFMIASVEEKAEVKKMLGVYLISCIVIYGAFGIWKLVVNILGSI